MTTTLLLLAIVLLALAGGAAGWWLHRRRSRIIGGATMTLEWPSAKEPRPQERIMPAEPVPRGPTASEFVERLLVGAFESQPDDDCQANPAAAAHRRIAKTAGALLSKIEPGSRYAPRRPQLLPQLLQVVSDEDSSRREIAALIGRDPALAGNLLRIANSALYRISPEPVETIERAVALIGTDGLRQMIAVALMQPVMHGGRGAFGRLPAVIWEHTLLAAAATAEHARQVEYVDGLTAQMLGLLHGLGSIVVVQVARDGYAQHPALAPESGVVGGLLERWAAPTAWRLARDWALSARIATALDDQRRDLPLAELSPLGRSLRIGRAAGAAALLQRWGEIDADAVLLLLKQELALDEEIAARMQERLSRT